MLLSSTYAQTAHYNADDPTQVRREVYTSPYGYSRFYFNRVPDAGSLAGLGMGGLNGFSSLPQSAQIAIVAVASAIVGYVGYAKFGEKYIKPQLRKIGLAGPSRKRHRR